MDTKFDLNVYLRGYMHRVKNKTVYLELLLIKDGNTAFT